jgi:hypothetical protein
MRLSLMKAAHVALFGTAYRKYGYLPGFGRCGIPQTSAPECKGVDDHSHQDLLPVESDRWIAAESHICQNRADMGHPSFVTVRDLTSGGRLRPPS